jgi:hypothetical protein
MSANVLQYVRLSPNLAKNAMQRKRMNIDLGNAMTVNEGIELLKMLCCGTSVDIELQENADDRCPAYTDAMLENHVR